MFPHDGSGADAASKPGSAKLQAKHAGGNAFRVYAKGMNSAAALHYQPLRRAASGKRVAAEASLGDPSNASRARYLPLEAVASWSTPLAISSAITL